jgi:hypothetical protein
MTRVYQKSRQSCDAHPLSSPRGAARGTSVPADRTIAGQVYISGHAATRRCRSLVLLSLTITLIIIAICVHAGHRYRIIQFGDTRCTGGCWKLCCKPGHSEKARRINRDRREKGVMLFLVVLIFGGAWILGIGAIDHALTTSDYFTEVETNPFEFLTRRCYSL